MPLPVCVCVCVCAPQSNYTTTSTTTNCESVVDMCLCVCVYEDSVLHVWDRAIRYGDTCCLNKLRDDQKLEEFFAV